MPGLKAILEAKPQVLRADDIKFYASLKIIDPLPLVGSTSGLRIADQLAQEFP